MVSCYFPVISCTETSFCFGGFFVFFSNSFSLDLKLVMGSLAKKKKKTAGCYFMFNGSSCVYIFKRKEKKCYLPILGLLILPTSFQQQAGGSTRIKNHENQPVYFQGKTSCN